MQNTVVERKNTLEGINSKWNDTEEWISELEDRGVEITDTEQKKKWKKWGQLKRSLGKHSKKLSHKNSNICIIVAPEEERKVREQVWGYHRWKLS